MLIIAALSDGYHMHLLAFMGYTSQGKLTNTIERYVHEVKFRTLCK